MREVPEVFEEHWNDEDGNPAGGVTYSAGFCISWQNGPLGRGNERREPNGAFVENVIKAVLGRLNYYQASKFNSDYNQRAIDHIEKGLAALQERTRDRERRQVEGTHSK